MSLMSPDQSVSPVTANECPYVRVPRCSTSIPDMNSGITKLILRVDESQTELTIDYTALGWNDGDSRITAMNLLAQLTNSPELIQSIVRIGAETLNREITKYLPVERLFEEVLGQSRDSLKEFRDRCKLGGMITGNILKLFGFSTQDNILTIFSKIAQRKPEEGKARSDALMAIKNIFLAKGVILSTVMSIIQSEKTSHTGVLDENPIYEQYLTGQVKKVIENGAESLNRIGIMSSFANIDEVDVKKLVDAEIKSAKRLLSQYYSDPERVGRIILPLRQRSDFVKTDHGDSLLRPPYASYIDAFKGHNTTTISLPDGTSQPLRQSIINCPFPTYAARR